MQHVQFVSPLPENGLDINERLAANMLGTMLYPQPNQAHERLATAHVLLMFWRSRFTGDSKKSPIEWGQDTLATRAEIIQLMQFIELSSLDTLRDRWRQGMIAGDVMRMLNWLYKHNPSKTSMKKARYMVSQLHSFHTKVGGKPTPLSETSIKNYWQEFRTVSHWWAGASEMMKTMGIVVREMEGSAKNTFSHVFMSIMNSPEPIISMGITHLQPVHSLSLPTKQAPNGILRAEECWHVPYEFVPSEIQAIFDPQQLYDGLSPWALDVLSNYKHA